MVVIHFPRISGKSYLNNLAKKYLGTYLILKDGVWYKVTKQYSSVNNKLVYLGEAEEVFTLGMGTPYVIEDEL
mgnify:CR=1 FL=1